MRRGIAVLALALLAMGAPLLAAPSPAVVSPAWLAERLAAPGSIAVLDARPSLKAYLEGHIPGAQPLVVENLRSSAGGVAATLYPWETIHLAIHRLGLGPQTPVVVYAEESDVDATYVATILRIAGLSDVSILDGGFERWEAEKRPLTKDRKLVAISTDKLVPDSKALIPMSEVLAAVEKKSALILDCRPPQAYAAGHIPGAKSRFWVKDVVPVGQPNAGSFRNEAEIKAELETLGVTKETQIIVYCTTGQQATDGFYTLKYRLGYPNVRLYNGSWLEWSITPGTPKEKDPAPPAAPPAPAK